MILCVNATTGGVTEWSLDWLGLGIYDGMLYGIDASSLMSLTGSAETDFSGEIKTGQMMLDGQNQVHVFESLFELAAEAETTLTTYTYPLGTGQTREYPLPVRTCDGEAAPITRREKLAKGPRGPYWEMQLAGADWSLTGWEISAVPSRRHG